MYPVFQKAFAEALHYKGADLRWAKRRSELPDPIEKRLAAETRRRGIHRLRNWFAAAIIGRNGGAGWRWRDGRRSLDFNNCGLPV